MTRTIVALSLVALAVAVRPASAQTPPAAAPADARWAAFIGCWRALDDTAGSGTRVCITPAAGGATFTTIVGGQKLSVDQRIADGASRLVDTDGCRGSETVRWSDNGYRLYRTATISCDGDAPRTLATASFFVGGPIWVDVETLEAGGTTSVRVSRLVRARNQALPDGTLVEPPAGVGGPSPEAMAGFTIADVIDLSHALPADGVQAALSEAPARYRLNAKTLVAMAEAGVDELVIDLMVGLTYPEKFDVQRAASAGWGGGGPGYASMADPFFAPLVGPAAMFNCHSTYGWATSTYWGNCMGYDSFRYSMNPGFYSGYWGAYGPGWVTTQAGGPATPAVADGGGRLVNGRGYTQVRPVETTLTMGRDAGRLGGTSGDGGSAPGSSGSAGVSGSGYSGSGGGERTAVPRGPGGLH